MIQRGLILGLCFAAGLQAGTILGPRSIAIGAAVLLGAAGARAAALRGLAMASACIALGILRSPSGPEGEAPQFEPAPVRVEGIVHEPPLEVPLPPRGGPREVRTLLTLRLPDGEDLMVQCSGALRGIRGGRLVRASGTLHAARSPRNPGDPPAPRRRFLEVPHPGALEVARGRMEPTFAGLTGALRGWIHGTISEVHPEPTRGFVLSMILGDRRLLPAEVREALLMTGTFHLLAISGLHVVLIMAFILRVPVPRRATLPFRLGVLALFAALTGASPPVLRAALMFAIDALLRLSGRRPRSLDTLGWTALLLLALDPALLGDIGFQLSFVSVASILAWSSRISERKEPATPEGGWTAGRALAASFALSIGTSAGTAPLTLLHFQRIHPLGPLWNVLGYPLTVVPVAGGFLTLLLAAIHPAAARPVAWAVDRASLGLLEPLLVGAELPGSAVFLAPPSAAAAAIAYGVLSGALFPAFRRTFIAIGAAALALLSAAALLEPRAAAVWLLDAGAGDAALVSVPGSGAILVDAGARGSGEGLRRALLATGHRAIAGAIITHPHADHIRGLGSLLGRLPVRTAWMGPHFRATEAGRDWAGRIEAAGIPTGELSRGRSVSFGRSLCIEALHPSSGETLPLSRSPNDASLAIRVWVEGLRILFLGDIEEDGAARLLASGSDLSTDVLLAPHHGRSNDLWPLLLERADPHTVIFSGNGEGGAREEAARLRSRGAVKVLATWEGGAIRISAGPGGEHEVVHAR